MGKTVQNRKGLTMDINNYSYTSNGFLDDGETYAEYMNGGGYGSISLEQWGSNPNKKHFVVTIYRAGVGEIIKDFSADASKDWETLRPAYAEAARLYNQYAPDADAVPLF